MVKILSSLHSQLSSHRDFFFAKDIADKEKIRKIALLYGICTIGIIFLGLLGILAQIQGNQLLGIFDFLAAFVLFLVLIFLKRKGALDLCIYTGLATMYCLYLYLFISGGVAGTAFVWSYTFPLFTFFLLGTQKGLLVSIFYLLSCLAVLLIDLIAPVGHVYSANLALRFIPSLLVVILFSLIYERFRETSHHAFVEATTDLEDKIVERTQELLREIQNRKKKEKELQISERRYRTLYDNSGDGIYITAIDGQYISANQQFCDQSEYSEDEIRTLTVHDLYQNSPTGSIQKLIDQVQTTGSAQFEAELVNRSGKHVPVEIRATRIEFDKTTAILFSCRDISQRKAEEEEKRVLQKQLFKAEKLEAMGMVAGEVAHDLNNILSGVITYPELLLRQLPESSDLRDPLQAIQDSGRRAATVVADLLTIARNVASTREAHDSNRLIQEYLNSPEYMQLKSSHPEVSCTTQLTAEYPTISCSSVHVKKAVMNLVTNAAEAMNNTGNINISTYNRQIEQSEELSREIAPGHYLIIQVQDNGPGISEQDQAHIFEPFYTKKTMGKSGTGLGLTIVWNTVLDHDGKVFIQSSEQGTIFQLYFPVSNQETAAKTQDDLSETYTGNQEHILVVDDEPQLRHLAEKILTALGYRVDTVSSGEMAIEFIKKTPVDLIVLDMLMDPGINGRQTYEEVIKIYPAQKALISSGFSKNHEIKKALDLGVGGFIKKPYSINQMGRSIKKILTH